MTQTAEKSNRVTQAVKTQIGELTVQVIDLQDTVGELTKQLAQYTQKQEEGIPEDITT